MSFVACGCLPLHMLCLGHSEGQISGKAKNSAKQTNNQKKNGMFRDNARPRPQPRFVGHRPGNQIRFHNFIAMQFDMEVASHSEASIP